VRQASQTFQPVSTTLRPAVALCPAEASAIRVDRHQHDSAAQNFGRTRTQTPCPRCAVGRIIHGWPRQSVCTMLKSERRSAHGSACGSNAARQPCGAAPRPNGSAIGGIFGWNAALSSRRNTRGGRRLPTVPLTVGCVQIPGGRRRNGAAHRNSKTTAPGGHSPRPRPVSSPAAEAQGREEGRDMRPPPGGLPAPAAVRTKGVDSSSLSRLPSSSGRIDDRRT